MKPLTAVPLDDPKLADLNGRYKASGALKKLRRAIPLIITRPFFLYRLPSNHRHFFRQGLRKLIKPRMRLRVSRGFAAIDDNTHRELSPYVFTNYRRSLILFNRHFLLYYRSAICSLFSFRSRFSHETRSGINNSSWQSKERNLSSGSGGTMSFQIRTAWERSYFASFRPCRNLFSRFAIQGQEDIELYGNEAQL